MTPEAQRIAIAEACPTLFVHVPSPYGPGGLHWREGKDDNGKTVSPGSHVDPLNDLNAMHEAVSYALSKAVYEDRVRYVEALQSVTGGEFFLCYEATAAQRAEAFLRSLNLWKE